MGDELTRTGEGDLQEQPLSYSDAMNPKTITPRTYESGGMTRIGFYGPDGENGVNVYRTVSLPLVGGRDVQDEVMLPGENIGTQYNFRYDDEGKLLTSSEKSLEEMPEVMRRAVDLIRQYSTQSGSRVFSPENGGTILVSDGLRWTVPAPSSPQSPAITEGPKQIRG